jgi:4-amino-4-deoxy-L-arabinose transferase-like glycosyltransferase
MRAVYRYWSWLVFVTVVVQVGFAGYGAFGAAHDIDDNGSVDEDMFNDSFGLHLGFGYFVILLGLVLLVISLIARHRIKHSGILAALLVLQWFLAIAGYISAALGVLHPVNALFIFALSGWIAMTEWHGRQAVTPATAMSAEPS